MKTTELTEIIRRIVKEEMRNSARNYINAQIPIVMAEVVEELVHDKLDTIIEALQELPVYEASPMLEHRTATRTGNAAKAKSLGTTSTVARRATPTKKLNLVTNVPGQDGSGYEPAVSADRIPESLLKALNTDYREKLALMNEKTSGYRETI